MSTKQMDDRDLPNATAIVIGASGALGAAFVQHLNQNQLPYNQVLSLSRNLQNDTSAHIDYAHEASIEASAAWVADKCHASPIRLLIVSTGYLHRDGAGPERSFQHLNVDYLQKVMLINAIGPALVLKHFAPLLPKTGEVRIVFISAKVGSIGDNSLGGWYGYRASKAALNQIVKTASIEITRRNKQSICVALHPGTVATALSEPFSKSGLNVRSPEVAAQELLSVIHALNPSQTGRFYDYKGESIVW